MHIMTYTMCILYAHHDVRNVYFYMYIMTYAMCIFYMHIMTYAMCIFICTS